MTDTCAAMGRLRKKTCLRSHEHGGLIRRPTDASSDSTWSGYGFLETTFRGIVMCRMFRLRFARWQRDAHRET